METETKTTDPKFIKISYRDAVIIKRGIAEMMEKGYIHPDDAPATFEQLLSLYAKYALVIPTDRLYVSTVLTYLAGKYHMIATNRF